MFSKLVKDVLYFFELFSFCEFLLDWLVFFICYDKNVFEFFYLFFICSFEVFYVGYGFVCVIVS